MSKTCSLADQTTLHASGLRTMPMAHPAVRCVVSHTAALPPICCPVSENPREGSTIRLQYRPSDRTLEVYTLNSVLKQFVGGYPGSACGTYPAERNMEGMIQLITQMAADALGVSVWAESSIILDAGLMTVSCEANPSVPQSSAQGGGL